MRSDGANFWRWLRFRCESCGGTVVFVGTLTSVECPYCGSPVQREHVHAGGWRLAVDAVLTFAVPRETAAQNLGTWVRSDRKSTRLNSSHELKSRMPYH